MRGTDLGLDGRRAVGTGASRGIGRRIALAMAEHGVSVVLAAGDPSALEDCAAEATALGVQCDAVSADLTTTEGIATVANLAVQREADILVNNVGLAEPSRLDELGDSEWQRGFAANFFSSVASRRLACPEWHRGIGADHQYLVHGRTRVRPVVRPYGAAKAALLSYSKAEIMGRTPDEAMAQMLLRKPIPANRLGDPREIAALAMFLASEPAAWLSGAAVPIDGGALAGVW